MSTTPLAGDDYGGQRHSDAELGMLECMLLSSDALGDFMEAGGSREWFFNTANVTIYAALVDRWTVGRPADIITITQILRERDQLEAVGGIRYLADLLTFPSTAANADYYLGILRDRYRGSN